MNILHLVHVILRNLIHFSFFNFRCMLLHFMWQNPTLLSWQLQEIEFIFLFNFRLMMLRFMQPDPIFLLQLHLDFWSVGYHDQEAIDVVNERLSRFAEKDF